MPRLLPKISMVIAVAASACAGLAPDPRSARAENLPEVVLTAEQRTAVERTAELAVDAVVQRQYAAAGRLAEQALAVDPRSARARAVRGMVLLQAAQEADPPTLARLRDGEREIQLAWQLAPQDAFVGWLRAVFLAEEGHMSAAAAAADEALAQTASRAPSELAALHGIAGTYRYELGEERAAIQHLQTYVGLRPDDAAAHFRLGACLLRAADLPQGAAATAGLVAQRQARASAAAFARCAELQPGDEDASLAVAVALLRAAELASRQSDPQQSGPLATPAGLREAARARLREVAARFVDSPEGLFRLGVLATDDGDDATAMETYRQALQRDPEHLPSLLNLAAIQATGGDVGAARETYRRLLAVAGAAALSPDERRRVVQWLDEHQEEAGRAATPPTQSSNEKSLSSWARPRRRPPMGSPRGRLATVSDQAPRML